MANLVVSQMTARMLQRPLEWTPPMKPLTIVLGLCLITSAAFARTPYAGIQARPVKALSDKDIADLKAGRGMGLALPAELNGYPGPLHVLELATPLGLS